MIFYLFPDNLAGFNNLVTPIVTIFTGIVIFLTLQFSKKQNNTNILLYRLSNVESRLNLLIPRQNELYFKRDVKNKEAVDEFFDAIKRQYDLVNEKKIKNIKANLEEYYAFLEDDYGITLLDICINYNLCCEELINILKDLDYNSQNKNIIVKLFINFAKRSLDNIYVKVDYIISSTDSNLMQEIKPWRDWLDTKSSYEKLKVKLAKI